MPNPQQPEPGRNRRSAAAADEAPARPGRKRASKSAKSAASTAAGPVPEDNLPGHHPPSEQDKPDRPPPTPARTRATGSTSSGGSRSRSTGSTPSGGSRSRSTGSTSSGGSRSASRSRPPGAAPSGASRSRATRGPARETTGEAAGETATGQAGMPGGPAGTAGTAGAAGSAGPTRPAGAAGTAGSPESPPGPGVERRFSFAFEPAQLVAGLPFGVTPLTTSLTVTSEVLRIRYGPWSLETPRSNVAGTEITGPYQLVKIAGPPHLSLADRGVTFATRRSSGVCIRFHEPVPAVLPMGLIRHPAVTVTVTEPDALVALLSAPA